MKENINKIIYIVLTAVIITACKRNAITNPKAYLAYLADKKHGLAKEKNIVGIRLKVKYLPSQYLAYNVTKEINNLKPREKDSIIRVYATSLTFLLNIGPSDNESFDITRLNVSSYQEFAERIEQMAFESQSWMTLKSDTIEQKPSLVKLETINAQDKSRNFIVVFNNCLGDKNQNDLCFAYTDELFNTGTSKFIFKAKDLQALPDFKF